MSDGSIHVSSEGLECTAFSSSDSIDELQRRTLIPGSKMSKDKCVQQYSCVILILLMQNPDEPSSFSVFKLCRSLTVTVLYVCSYLQQKPGQT